MGPHRESWMQGRHRIRVAARIAFPVCLYNGQRRDTVKHNGLPPLSQQRVESSFANPGGCAQAQLHAIADSQQAVPEASESNNSASIQQVPPCPDLVVHIQKDDVDTLRYRAKVKVTNQGTRATGRHVMVFASGSKISRRARA